MLEKLRASSVGAAYIDNILRAQFVLDAALTERVPLGDLCGFLFKASSELPASDGQLPTQESGEPDFVTDPFLQRSKSLISPLYRTSCN